MTIKELQTEIEVWHRSVYPESDAKVWPLCLAKLVEEWGEYRDRQCDDECADFIIAAIAARSRANDIQKVNLARMLSLIDQFTQVIVFGSWRGLPIPRWLESRWNEVKQRTPEMQRQRDKERGIEIEEDEN